MISNKTSKQYTVKVGAFLRGKVKHKILTYAPQIGMVVSVTEAKTVDTSTFVFTLEGNELQHRVFAQFLELVRKEYS